MENVNLDEAIKNNRMGTLTIKTAPNASVKVKQLKHDIKKMTREKEAFVREAEGKENRLLSLLFGLHTIWKDQQFIKLIKSENLGPMPDLKGKYNVI